MNTMHAVPLQEVKVALNAYLGAKNLR